jgi:alkylmercury lyase
MAGLLDTESAVVRDAAFRRLLRTGAPASTEQLAADLDRTPGEVSAAVATLHQRGSIRRDNDGAVTGAGGLSIQPDRHQIELGGRRFWTWCAYDILGIFAALQASGWAVSPSPGLDEPIRLTFRDGRPDPAEAVLFRPDEEIAECCENVYEQWCPNSNLFPTAEAATTWARSRDVPGRVLDLATAARLGGEEWRPLLTDAREQPA